MFPSRNRDVKSFQDKPKNHHRSRQQTATHPVSNSNKFPVHTRKQDNYNNRLFDNFRSSTKQQNHQPMKKFNFENLIGEKHRTVDYSSLTSSSDFETENESAEDLYMNQHFSSHCCSSFASSVTLLETEVKNEIENIRKSLLSIVQNFMNQRYNEGVLKQQKSTVKRKGKHKTDSKSILEESSDILKKCEVERESCYQRIQANIIKLRSLDTTISTLQKKVQIT